MLPQWQFILRRRMVSTLDGFYCTLAYTNRPLKPFTIYIFTKQIVV